MSILYILEQIVRITIMIDSGNVVLRANMGKRITVTYQSGASSSNDTKHKVSGVEIAKRGIASG